MIYFADKNNTYAMNMHAGMQDVIDGSRAYFERTVGFNANATSFDIRANLTRFEFAINMPLLDVQDLSAYIKIEQDDKTYYAFVVDYAVINDKTTLVKFEIDWWHTSFVGQTLPTLERAWISRDNVHDVIATNLTHNGKTVYEVLCGEGEEAVNPLNLQSLASSIPQGACIEHRTTPIMSGATITHDLDDRLLFVRVITTKSFSHNGKPTVSNIATPLYNSLYVGYIMFVLNPNGVDVNTYKVQGTHSGSVVNEIYKLGAGATINQATAWLGAWASDPNTVSIDVVGYMPVIKSIEKTTVDGLTYYYINFIDSDNDTTFYLHDSDTSTDVTRTTFTWLGDLPTPKFYTPLTYDMLHVLGILHTTDSYSHTNGEDLQDIVEPKFAQPQYSTLRVTNYKSEGVQVNPYNAFNGNFSLIESGFGNIETLDVKTRIDQSYNEPTAQSSYAPIGAMNGEMLHENGDDEGYRDISQVDTSLNELPIINDQYLTYMQNKRNSFQTGYALQQRQLDLGYKYALGKGITDTIVAGANMAMGLGEVLGGGDVNIAQVNRDLGSTVKTALNLAQTVETNKFNRDALQQTHNAFIADLKNAVKGVKGGNNAVYAVSRGDLWLTWELWQVTAVDKIRLHDYFKYNGYARNETRKQISLDSMYYFDYVEADNITFDKGLTLGAIALNAIRSQLSNGVRIWHERGGAFMHTDFMNTAKDF